MSSHREIELKYALASRDDYERLLRGIRGERACVERLQINEYFDSAARTLLRARSLLRLRQEESAVLTFKHGGERPRELGLFDADEIEEAISPELAESIRHEPRVLADLPAAPCREMVRRFGRLELELLGRLENHRTRAEGSFTVEIDRMIFPDGAEGYEVEVECADPAAARLWLEDALSRSGALAEPERRTKLERLVERIDRARGGVDPRSVPTAPVRGEPA